MKLVTNPGSNLSPAAVERYDVRVAPQRIIVDDTEQDTRVPISFTEIEGWVSRAKEHPYVVGTTAAELAVVFREAARDDPEMLAVMTSRKIIKSFDAAKSAARTVRPPQGATPPRIEVVDSGSTDVGPGLATIMAGEAMREGRSLDECVALVEAFARSSRFVLTVASLDWLVKGGRASALRAWLANILHVKPLIGFVDGELEPVGKLGRRDDPAEGVAGHLERELGSGRRVWAAISHGDDPMKARLVAAELRKRLQVDYLYLRPISPSIYLHTARGAVTACAVPVDELPFVPPVPPEL